MKEEKHMNDTLKTIAERYSCRSYTDEMPTAEELQLIANAAIQAPSGINRQAWRVIIVKNKQLIKEMEAEGMNILSAMPDKTMYDRIMSRGGSLYYNAPSLIMVPINPTDYAGAVLDCGILCQNVALAATSLGLGNVICGLAGLAFAGNRAAEFKEKLGFPTGFEFGAAILIGHASAATSPHEPDKSKISVIE